MKTKPLLPAFMSYCLNLDCQKPQNPAKTNFCQSCGSTLLLGKRYRALKLIGQGGFGKTFLAIDEDKPSKPLCVIKQFFPRGAGFTQGTNSIQKAVKLFDQEAQRLDQLGKHPQIPECLAYFTQGNRQYLVQEFIEGQTLAEILRTDGAFSERQIRGLLSSLLPVLEFIHTHNVIHRDIKPENIIRRPPPPPPYQQGARQSQLVLVDFGAAKLATGTALALTGTVIGSAGYAAPEQARGKAFLTSDLYSLGVTCIHLLTEVDPFDLYSDSEDAWVWRDYLNNNPVSQQLGQILDKMLEKATSKRYQSATEILKDLKVLPTTVAAMPAPSVGTATASAGFAAASMQSEHDWRCVQTLAGHEKRVNAIAISPDGQIIASGGADKIIKLWHLTTGEVRTLRGHRDSIRAIAFSPDGQLLVSSGNDCTIKIWQLAKSKKPLTLKGHYGFINSIAISPDGQILASADEGETSELKLWRLPHGEQIAYSGTDYYVSCVAFSPDGLLLAIGRSFEGIKLWQISTRQEICILKRSGTVTSLTFSPDGQLLANSNAGNTIKIWQLNSGEELFTLKTHPAKFNSTKRHTAKVNSVAFSPDGQTLASGSDDKTIKIWQLNTGKVICTLKEHLAPIQSIAFSPDGQTLVSGSWDTTIKVWQCVN
jgi:WD40 repeat protein